MSDINFIFGLIYLVMWIYSTRSQDGTYHNLFKSNYKLLLKYFMNNISLYIVYVIFTDIMADILTSAS